MKNLTWIIAVLVLSFAGDRVGAWLLGNIVENSQFRYSRLYKGEANADVLLVGNSRGLIFYQPYIEEVTGLTTVNLSYNGMPIDLSNVLVKDYIDKNGAPKILILDVTMLDKRMDARLSCSFNLYTPYSKRLSTLLKENFPTSFYGGKVANLYRYNSEVFQRAFYYLNKSDEDWLLDRIISNSVVEAIKAVPPFEYEYTEKMLADLTEMVKYAEDRGVEVKLVINPYFPAFADKIVNSAALQSAIKASTGNEVHDFSNSVQGVEGFGDYQHLNKTGARKYIDLLVAEGFFYK